MVVAHARVQGEAVGDGELILGKKSPNFGVAIVIQVWNVGVDIVVPLVLAQIVAEIGSARQPVFLAAGKPAHFVAQIQDINKRKQAQEALQDAHAESELFINSVPSILIGTDAEGRINRWNLAATQTFALPASAVFGKAQGLRHRVGLSQRRGGNRFLVPHPEGGQTQRSAIREGRRAALSRSLGEPGYVRQ